MSGFALAKIINESIIFISLSVKMKILTKTSTRGSFEMCLPLRVKIENSYFVKTERNFRKVLTYLGPHLAALRFPGVVGRFPFREKV